MRSEIVSCLHSLLCAFSTNIAQKEFVRGLLPCSVLAAGGPANDDDLQIGYEAGLWQLLDLFFLHHDDLQHGAFPEVSTGSTECGAGQRA